MLEEEYPEPILIDPEFTFEELQTSAKIGVWLEKVHQDDIIKDGANAGVCFVQSDTGWKPSMHVQLGPFRIIFGWVY